MEYGELFGNSGPSYINEEHIDVQFTKESTDAFNPYSASQSIPLYSYNEPIQQTYAFDELDEEERARRETLEKDEENRRNKLREKLNHELEVKQQFREKARDYLEQWKEQRHKRVSEGRSNNKLYEQELINERQSVKESKKNPWDLVVSNINLKESDYKGTKDVSRMRACIINRKADLSEKK